MVSVLERQIREQVAEYIAGELSLAQLKDWIMPVLWETDRDADPTAYALAAEINARLIEYSNGDWLDSEVRDLLDPLSLIASHG